MRPLRIVALAVALCITMSGQAHAETFTSAGQHGSAMAPVWVSQTGTLPAGLGDATHAESGTTDGRLSVQASTSVNTLPGGCVVMMDPVWQDPCTLAGYTGPYSLNRAYANSSAYVTKVVSLPTAGRYEITADLSDPSLNGDASSTAYEVAPSTNVWSSGYARSSLRVWLSFTPGAGCSGCSSKSEEEYWAISACQSMSGRPVTCFETPQSLLREWIQPAGPGTLTVEVRLDGWSEALGASSSTVATAVTVDGISVVKL